VARILFIVKVWGLVLNISFLEKASVQVQRLNMNAVACGRGWAKIAKLMRFLD